MAATVKTFAQILKENFRIYLSVNFQKMLNFVGDGFKQYNAKKATTLLLNEVNTFVCLDLGTVKVQ